jgi:uncharacterized protein
MFRASDIDIVAGLERILASHARGLTARRGVRTVSLVGSRARGTARPESDIDLLLDLAPDTTFGLIDLVQLKDTLGDALGRKVDIAFKGGMRSYVEAHMTRDARQVLCRKGCRKGVVHTDPDRIEASRMARLREPQRPPCSAHSYRCAARRCSSSASAPFSASEPGSSCMNVSEQGAFVQRNLFSAMAYLRPRGFRVS